MPVYEYECGKCGKKYEFMHGFDEAPPRKLCEDCRGKLKKVFSPVGVVFKGSGFYINDSNKGKENKAREKYEKMGKSEVTTKDSLNSKIDNIKKTGTSEKAGS